MAFIKRGSVYCSSCNHVVRPKPGKTEISCQLCGHPNMYIRLKWEGKEYRLYEDRQGNTHHYSDAVDDLVEINKQIKAKSFDIAEWLPETCGDKLFSKQIAVWLERKEKETRDGKLAPSTLGNYQTYSRRYYLESRHLRNVDVREIRLKHLQRFYDDLPGSPKYRKNILDALHTFFRFMVRWGEITEVPVWPEIEEVIEHERFALTYEEQQEVLRNIPTEHRDIIEFMMETGLRPGEACALMLVDIDPKRGRALVRRTYSEGQLRNKVKQKKEYWIVLSDRAMELVRANMGNRAAVDAVGEKTDRSKRTVGPVRGEKHDTKDHMTLITTPVPPSPFVFTNPETKGGYKYKFIYRIWKQYSGTDLDLYEGTRHSFCTQIVEEGASEMQAQSLMRHADGRSTKRYFHPTDERMKSLVNRRGKVVELRKERSDSDDKPAK